MLYCVVIRSVTHSLGPSANTQSGCVINLTDGQVLKMLCDQDPDATGSIAQLHGEFEGALLTLLGQLRSWASCRSSRRLRGYL